MKWFQYFLMIVLSVWLTACQTKVSPPCKNLGKVHNIDDWLYQVYSNIDSQCLFEMPVSELEKIWGLPVIDWTASVSADLEEVRFAQNRARMDKAETFYIFKQMDGGDGLGKISFQIVASDKYYEKNQHSYGGSLGAGLLPTQLPSPTFMLDRYPRIRTGKIPYDYDINRSFYDNHPAMKNPRQYRPFHNYIWINTAHRRNMPSLSMSTSFIPTAGNIIFYNHTNQLYIHYFDKWISGYEDLFNL